MASGRNLTVYLTSDVSKFTKGLRQGESGLKRFGQAVGVGVAAVGALAAKLGVDAVQAAAEDQKRLAQLTKVMENFGKAAEVPELNDAIDAMQKQYGVAEDQLTPAFIRLLAATDDTQQALKLVTLALDLSAASGKSLDMSAKSLARAIEGSTGGLAKLGVGLSAADIKAAGLEGTIGILEDRFGGTAAAAAQTMTGKMDRLGIALGEVQESGGTGFLEGFIGPDADEAIDNMGQMEDDAYRVGKAIGDLATDALAAARNFVIGLQAIPTVWGEWTNQVAGVPVEVMDALGFISDEKAAAIRKARDQQTARNNMTLSGIVNGSDFGNNALNGGGTFGEASRWGNAYAGVTSYSPMRYGSNARSQAKRSRTRAAQVEAKSNGRP